jgi:hypothetical protein
LSVVEAASRLSPSDPFRIRLPRLPAVNRSCTIRRNKALCAASGREQVGVVIVDHGSKKQESNEMLEQFAEVFDLHSDYDIVECAHMEIAEPSILQASEKCIQRGATSVVIAPYFLSRYRMPAATLKCFIILYCLLVYFCPSPARAWLVFVFSSTPSKCKLCTLAIPLIFHHLCCVSTRCCVDIAPTFCVNISRGRHIQKDIPAIVEDAERTFPNVKFVIADPIGD